MYKHRLGSLILGLVIVSGCGQSIVTRSKSERADVASGTSAADTTALAIASPSVVETATLAAPANQAPSVPTPQALDQFSAVRPVWLVAGDQLVAGTRGTSGTSDVLPSSTFLKSIVNVPFPDKTPITVIVSTTPIERFSAAIKAWDENTPDQILPASPDSTYPHLFIVDPPQNVHNQLLTVYVRFGLGQDATYHWRLNARSE